MAEPEPINDTDPALSQDSITETPDFKTPLNLEKLREAAAAAFPERDIDPSLVDDLYYDGRNVFMQGDDGVWRYEAASFATATLKERGFSERVPKGAYLSKSRWSGARPIPSTPNMGAWGKEVSQHRNR